jgi:hypothetical protein
MPAWRVPGRRGDRFDGRFGRRDGESGRRISLFDEMI